MHLTPWEARALRRIEEQFRSECPHVHELFAQLQPPPPPRTRSAAPIPFNTAVMLAMVPVVMVAALWLLLPGQSLTCTEPIGAVAPPVASATNGSVQPATAAAGTCTRPGP